MFGELLKGFIDTEQMTRNTIQNAIHGFAQELEVKPSQIVIMIATNDDETCVPSFFLYKKEDKVPVFVREVKLKEILGNEK